MKDEWIAAISALVGGVLMKAIDALIRKPHDTMRDHLALREELRHEINDLRQEVQRTARELESWRSKYYSLLDEHLAIKSELKRLQSKLETQAQPEVIL